jgi:hypothetical protein
MNPTTPADRQVFTDTSARADSRDSGEMMMTGSTSTQRPVDRSGNASTPSGQYAAHARDGWAQLWFAAHRYPWSTLAIVPADIGERMLGAARAFAAAGQLYEPRGVQLIEAIHAGPGAIPEVLAEANRLVHDGRKVIIVVDCPLSNPAAIAIARAVDAALLAVVLGSARLSHARRALDTIGRERFIGSVAIQKGDPRARAR